MRPMATFTCCGEPVATQGADLTKALTLDDLRNPRRRATKRVGPEGRRWVVGWGLTFEMFPADRVRGDTFADSVRRQTPYLRFF